MRILGAVGLAVLALFFWGASYAMTGAQPRETPDMECFERMPRGWDESADADWRMDHLPPRLHCTMTDGRTGEVVTWNSGNASLPAFVATGLALAASVVLLVGDARSRY